MERKRGKKKYSEVDLELLQPRRYRVYRKLLDSFLEARKKGDVDYSADEFKDASGNTDPELVRQYADRMAEEELAQHAYILSEFMDMEDVEYDISLPVTAISRKHSSSKGFVYLPQTLQVKAKVIQKKEEISGARGGDMILDGYMLLVDDGVKVTDITNSVDLGYAYFDLRYIVGEPQSIAVRLVRRGTLDGVNEVVKEVSVSIIDVPYMEDTDVDNFRIEFRGIEDSFIMYGETKHIECKVFNGWKDVTDDVVAWSITRNTGSEIEDIAWSAKRKAVDFNGIIDIVFSQYENDLGEAQKADFTVCATLKSSASVTAVLEF